MESFQICLLEIHTLPIECLLILCWFLLAPELDTNSSVVSTSEGDKL